MIGAAVGVGPGEARLSEAGAGMEEALPSLALPFRLYWTVASRSMSETDLGFLSSRWWAVNRARGAGAGGTYGGPNSTVTIEGARPTSPGSNPRSTTREERGKGSTNVPNRGAIDGEPLALRSFGFPFSHDSQKQWRMPIVRQKIYKPQRRLTKLNLSPLCKPVVPRRPLFVNRDPKPKNTKET